MIAIFQILYFIVFLSMLLMSIFIIFHIVMYSYSTISKLVTLLIFVPVAGVLLFTNLVIFTKIPFENIFSIFFAIKNKSRHLWMNFQNFISKDIGANETIIQVIHRNWFYLLEQFFF